MTTATIMSITNLCIFIVILYAYEFYLKKRAQKAEVFFLTSEERWYRVLMLILAGSVFVMDIFSDQTSFFVYAVLFFSYTFTFKEIGSQGIVCNLRRTPLEKINNISIVDRKHSFVVIYETKERKFEMIVRKALAKDLDQAVEKAKRLL